MKPTILFIDDEDIVLKSCRRIFENSDYNIDTAVNGEEGLEKIEGGEYDIVVTDLKMPGIEGMEVLKTLQKKRPEIIVIIFTGYANVETAREALKNGAFDYIPKPFSPDEMRDVISNATKAIKDRENVPMLDLMAIVTHELKSPVSVMHTTAETLYKGYFGNIDPEQKKIVETIIRNCEYLEDIIRSYIDLSKMELDELDSFMEKIDVYKDVVEPVITVPETEKNRKNMKLVTDIQDCPTVHADPRLLKIVVSNLVNNAVKYGKENTDIEIALKSEGGNLVFSVLNEGVGFTREDIETKLFTKFSRLKQRGTEGVKGSGLGLYICKKIIDKHGGRIWAESEQGSWAKFIFTLPVK